MEDLEGYTIVRSNDRWYYYAVTGFDGKLSPTVHKVGKVDPNTKTLTKNVRVSQEIFDSLMQVKADFMAQLPKRTNVTGPQRLAVIVVDFPGQNPTGTEHRTKSDYVNFLFSEDYYNTAENDVVNVSN